MFWWLINSLELRSRCRGTDAVLNQFKKNSGVIWIQLIRAASIVYRFLRKNARQKVRLRIYGILGFYLDFGIWVWIFGFSDLESRWVYFRTCDIADVPPYRGDSAEIFPEFKVLEIFGNFWKIILLELIWFYDQLYLFWKIESSLKLLFY